MYQIEGHLTTKVNKNLIKSLVEMSSRPGRDRRLKLKAKRAVGWNPGEREKQ